MKTLKYEGNGFFRQRITLSLLSGKAIEIHKINLTEIHGNFFRLIEKISNGTILKITKNGSVLFKPGVIVGGNYLTHDCSLKRGIGYFLEPLLVVCLFGNKPTTITLRGITNCKNDVSVDMFRNLTCQIVSKFGIDEAPSITLVKRGAEPLGGGEIKFFSPIIKTPLKSILLTEEGIIKRIRGLCYSTNISSSICNRVSHSAKGFLLNYIPNIFVSTDHFSGKFSGKSSGYAIYLEAETLNGNKIAVEYTAPKGSIPEDIGVHSAKLLCQEIKNGGCIDSCNQWFVLLLMSISEAKVSRVRVGKKLNPYALEYLRHIKDFLGVQFDVKPVENEENENESIICMCVGCGLKNLHWKTG